MLLLTVFLACSDESPPEPAPKEAVADVEPKEGHDHGDHDQAPTAADPGEVPQGAKVFFISPRVSLARAGC